MGNDMMSATTAGSGRTGVPGAPVVRRATPADAEGIVRLRSDVGLSGRLDEEWISRCSTQMTARLAPGGDARAFVVDAPDGTPASCALGLIHPVLPEPSCPGGLAARVHTVATRPGHRRRGLARAVLTALVDRLHAEGVTLFESHAGDEAAALHRRLGFAAGPAPMRMTRLEEPVRRIDEPETERTWLPPEQYAETLMKATGFACVYFTDAHDRPLQLRSVYSATHPWQLAGGTMDPGERPWQTATRECLEETGIAVDGPPRLLAAVYGLPGAEWPYSTMGAVFDGGRLTDEQIRHLVLDPREHDEVRVLPLREWKSLMPRRDFARLCAVAEARRTGVAAYYDTWDWGQE